MTEDEMVGWHHQLDVHELSKLRELVMDREAWHAAVPGAAKPSIRVFSNESTLRMRWPKYWSVSFSISPSKEIPGQISFRMD